MSMDLTDDMSTLVQVMAWCHQASSHYLSQCWPRSMPYGITRPQWRFYSVTHPPRSLFSANDEQRRYQQRHHLLLILSERKKITWECLIVICLNFTGKIQFSVAKQTHWTAMSNVTLFNHNDALWRLSTCHGQCWLNNGPLTRNVKLRVVHVPGMAGTFSAPPQVSDPDMHHGTCGTHVLWCMPESLTGAFLWSRQENVPIIPGACATRNFTYLVRGPLSVAWQHQAITQANFAWLIISCGIHFTTILLMMFIIIINMNLNIHIHVLHIWNHNHMSQRQFTLTLWPLGDFTEISDKELSS